MFDDGVKAARALLIKHEGLKKFPYVDTTGNLTIGYGHNLTENGLSGKVCSFILDDDIDYWMDKLPNALSFFKNLSPGRQAVLIDMCYNLGLLGLLGFRKMIAALNAGNYDLAADCMLDSKWAVQVGSRAMEDAEIMRSGRL